AALRGERHHGVEALVARAAKLLRQLEGVQPRRVEDLRVFQILRPRRGDVSLAGAVAGLAVDAGHGALRLKARAAGGRRRVATETPFGGLQAHGAAQRVFERRGDGARVLDGDVEAAEFGEVADAAFVERAAVPEDVGLSGHALAEAEEYGFRDHARAVGDGVGAAAPLARARVCVWAVAEGEPRAGLQDLAVGCTLRRAAHRRRGLRARLLRVALGAGARAHVADARVVARGTPPGKGVAPTRLALAAR